MSRIAMSGYDWIIANERYDPSPTTTARDHQCSLCNRDKSSSLIDFYPINNNCGLERLKNSAAHGCRFCGVMLDAVQWAVSNSFGSEQQIKSIGFGNGLFIKSWDDSRSREIEFLDLSGAHSKSYGLRSLPCKILLKLAHYKGHNNKLIDHLKVVPGQTDSEQTFGNIRKWLSDCLTNHEKCYSNQKLTDIPCQRPSRLLDISSNHVKLRDDAQRGRYACLSHRWGSVTSMLRLTKENMEDFRVQIPYQQLPRNFKDAIDICRRLDIHLLWIDALCIIQDSSEDWNREAPCMGVYYRDAVFTIAATSAEDSSGGCYTHAEPQYKGGLLPNNPDIHVRMRQHAFEEGENLNWPLLERGWVYQEMQLSTRKLHFTTNEVIWDCSKGIRSESGTHDCNHSEKNTVLHPQNPEIDWHKIVSYYSSLSLTFEDDRLPALSSITEWMEQLRSGDQFLLGLWERTLLLDLCWRTAPWTLKECKPRSVATKALPTWTWASMPAPVHYATSSNSLPLEFVTVLDIIVYVNGQHRMGQIRGEASITLVAPVIRLGSLGYWTPGPVQMMNDEGKGMVRALHERLREPGNGLDGTPNAPPLHEIAAEFFELDLDLFSKARGISNDQPHRLSMRGPESLNDETLVIPLSYSHDDLRFQVLCVERAPGTSRYRRLGVAYLAHIEQFWYSIPGALSFMFDEDFDDQMERKFEHAKDILESLPRSTIVLV
ncbi:hypothetical protein G7Y89_g7985 [Cudoniella acicularis]|uniref:Heterokaryon incompatibility domain-containing protein n=1 Tax=Cudoniella acicularis TaxID=354080 RepID=A0A8H4RL15_9HELO|nr:hypothetical protein G7Y89_g7985 [Cudoniella acicularis]